MRSRLQQVEACVRELKMHGMVVESGEQGKEQAYVLSGKILQMIDEAMSHMRKRYPKATEESVKYRALIFVVLHKMGLVEEKSLPVYICVLNSLADWKLVDNQ